MAGVVGNRVVSPRLVGRADELELSLGATSAPPAVVVVEGEAGVGKTRLVTELADRVEGYDVRVLAGGCLRIREPFPLGPVLEAVRGCGGDLAAARLSPVVGALRPLLPELSEMLPPPPPALADRAAERHRLFRALAEVLAALGPAVLMLDDLHWADEQTVDFLGYLLGDPPPKLALVLTYRGEEVSPDVRALTARLPTVVSQARLALPPLDVADTGALAAAILELDRVPAEFAEQLWHRTAGLPLALEELLALLRMHGDPVHQALDELDVPSGIRDHVWQRVGGLSAQTRSVVEAAAVLQVAVPISTLVATSGVSQRQARTGMQEALDAGVLVETTAGIGFRHPLAAQAVYEGISGPRGQELHLRATTALGELPEPPLGQVAHHLRKAGRLTAWVEAAQRAADQAVQLGHEDEAARLLEDVLRHAPLEVTQQASIAVKLGRAAIQALHPSQDVAGLLANLLQQDLPRQERGELRVRQAMLLERLGLDDARLRRSLLASAAEDLDELPEVKAQAMFGLGLPNVPGVPLAESREWLHCVLRTLPEVADPAYRVLLLGKVAGVLAVIGDPDWWRLTERILDETGGAPRERRERNAYSAVAFAACYAGHLPAADRLLTAARDEVPHDDGGHVGRRVHTAQALLDYCRGAWDGLAERVEVLLDQLTGDAPGRGVAEVIAGCLALARGDLDRAAGWLAPVQHRLEQRGHYDLLPIPTMAMIRIALGRGDPDALVMARRLLTTMAPVPYQVSAARALPAVIEALVAAGEVSEAGAVVEQYAGEFATLDAPLGEPGLRHARGLLAGSAGQWRLAAEHLTAAADSYDRLHCPYEAAQAREQAAVALLRTGGAGDSLRAALATYQRLGAEWDYSRAAATARRHGVSVPARRQSGRRDYQSDLSPREREVAELAATGRTNKEISSELYVSVNTVKKQLASAMRKLGVRSRAELALRIRLG